MRLSAVRIVSGRPLADLRRYLPETPVDIVAEHGAVLARTGEIAILAPAWPHAWRDAIRDSEQRFTGLFVERKHASIALHYRARPEIEGELLALAERMRRTVRGDFTVTCSSFTIEIRPQHIDKGRAIQALMTTAPYAGRRPVFVADDETDRPGFKVVSALDGLALWVDEAFGGSTAKVRAWLAEIAGLEGIY